MHLAVTLLESVDFDRVHCGRCYSTLSLRLPHAPGVPLSRDRGQGPMTHTQRTHLAHAPDSEDREVVQETTGMTDPAEDVDDARRQRHGRPRHGREGSGRQLCARRRAGSGRRAARPRRLRPLTIASARRRALSHAGPRVRGAASQRPWLNQRRMVRMLGTVAWSRACRCGAARWCWDRVAAGEASLGLARSRVVASGRQPGLEAAVIRRRGGVACVLGGRRARGLRPAPVKQRV